MIIYPYGPTALLLEDPLPGALYRRLRVAALPGIVDLVPAAHTVAVYFDPATTTAEILINQITSLPEDTAVMDLPGRLHEIPVRYDGEDLESVAAHVGMTPSELIAVHSSAVWRAEFGGFAPGFMYLVAQGLDLAVPRRATPRVRVPGGTVALAGHYSAVYPRSSPGGWQLIGSTEFAFWDVGRPGGALVRPGDEVRFVAVGRD